MKLEEMSPKLRKAAVAALAKDLAHRQAPPAPEPPTGRKVARASCTWQCAKCGAEIRSWAACERHSDTSGHARYAMLLEPVEGHRKETGN